MEHRHRKKHAGDPHEGAQHYTRLLLMALLSFLAMYALMYAMVNEFENVYLNVNQFYMAGLMAAPMVVLEFILMGHVYRHKVRNAAIIAGSLVAMVGCWALIRHQTAVSDRQFLRSMIPHHAGALLMCEEASLSDPEIRALCERIKAGQRAEIDLMVRKLRELEAGPGR
jgi:predicted exporter